MADATLRSLQRGVESNPGDIDTLRRFANSCLRINGVEYFIESGGPWIRFHERDELKVMSQYNVEPGIHLHWEQERFKHSRRNWQHGGEDYFTQDRLADILINEMGDGERKGRENPDSAHYHNAVVFNRRVKDLGLQQEEWQRAHALFKDDFDKAVLTSRRVVYGGGKVICSYRMPGERVIAEELTGKRAFLRDLPDKGVRFLRLTLEAHEHIERLDEWYNDAAGTSRGMYGWRLQDDEVSGEDERAVVLGRGVVNNRFNVNAVDDGYDRPVRLVVAHNAKNFSIGNEGEE